MSTHKSESALHDKLQEAVNKGEMDPDTAREQYERTIRERKRIENEQCIYDISGRSGIEALSLIYHARQHIILSGYYGAEATAMLNAWATLMVLPFATEAELRDFTSNAKEETNHHP